MCQHGSGDGQRDQRRAGEEPATRREQQQQRVPAGGEQAGGDRYEPGNVGRGTGEPGREQQRDGQRDER